MKDGLLDGDLRRFRLYAEVVCGGFVLCGRSQVASTVIGGLLVLTGLLTLSLPRLAEMASDDSPEDKMPAGIRPAAVLLTGLLFLGTAYGLMRGEPWVLTEAPMFERRAVEGSGLSFELPSRLPEPERITDKESPVSVVYGDFLSSP